MTTGPGNAMLDAALAYAARGWRVVPLRERQKGPWVDDWPNVATTDPEQVRAWWGERPESNVGVALGPGSGLVGVDVDSDEGERLLAELSAGDLPDTLHMTTGKGTRLLYAIPAGLPRVPKTVVIKGADGKEALRFQSTGGQCVMPPSVHPTGKVYAFVEEHAPSDRPAAPMPAWMRMLMCPPEDQPEQHESTAWRAFTAGGDFNKRGSWDELLAAHGFRPAGRRDQVRYFTRPGKTGGVSVTLGYYRAKDGTPALFVFSGSIPELAPDKCYDLFGAFARLEHRGDFQAASRALEGMGFGPQKATAQAKGKGGAAAPPPAAGQPWEAKPCGVRPGLGITAAELVDKAFPPPRWAVEGLLPEGLTVLCGRPKQGKSWLSLLVATAVAAGHPLDGRAVPTGGRVVYLALEDTERRLKERLLTLRKGVSWAVPERLHLITRWPRADDGGLAHLHEFLSEHTDTVFLIVDTLAKFRTPPKGNANSYADDYAAIDGLKGLLEHHKCSGLLIHHTRKQKAEDPFDEISGTQGLSGSADGMMVLDRTRGSAEAKLYATGRDLPEQTVALTWGAEHCRWTLGKATSGIEADGRGETPGKVVGLIEGCCVWLRKFLADYAFPSAEVDAAAKAAGFSYPTLKSAREQLSWRVGGPLYPKNLAGIWWNGLGTHDTWRFRPELRNFGTSEDRTPPRKDTGEGADPDDGF